MSRVVGDGHKGGYPVRVGSLFAGVGGFDIAAERAGMQVVWQSEVDPAASRVLEHHWPGRNLGDIHGITMADGRGPERFAPAVDVLCGGFPCQDYSVAGNRAGLAGDRGALWWEYHRLITEGRPTWVVAENVPGLLSSRGGRDFATIIDSLAECGYGVAWAVLDAQYFGVAQRRRRVFIVGHSGGRPRPEILALSEGVYGHPAPRRETRQDVAPTLASRTRGGGGLGTDTELDGALIPFTKQRLGHYIDADVGSTLAQRDYKDATDLVASLSSPQVRRLTPLECERLQGFPGGWGDLPGNSDTQRYRQMGNAVAVPVVEWIMKRIATMGNPHEV